MLQGLKAAVLGGGRLRPEVGALRSEVGVEQGLLEHGLIARKGRGS